MKTEGKPSEYNRLLDGHCPHCGFYQARMFRAEKGGHPIEAKAICRACKNDMSITDGERIAWQTGRNRQPSLDDLVTAAERLEHVCPSLARMALKQIEAGAFRGAPQNMDEILEQADNGDPF